MLGPAELVGGRLVDRHRHRSRRRIAAVGAAMEDEGLGIGGFDHRSVSFVAGLSQAATERRPPAMLRLRCSATAAFTASLWVSGSRWPARSMVLSWALGRQSAR